jgi:hypothetical protein
MAAGGRSSGSIQELDDGMIFSGNINVNGGGFSSVSRGLGRKNLAGETDAPRRLHLPIIARF